MDLTTEANLALLILRVVAGLTLAAHGWNKFFGGGRIPGTGRLGLGHPRSWRVVCGREPRYCH